MPPSQSVLLVEGQDDEYAVDKLLAKNGLVRSFDIQIKRGFDELRKSIYSEVNAPKRQKIGIVVDANDHPKRRWQSISDKLKEANCSKIPQDPTVGGTILAGPRGVTVGVWLMPDNQSPGELEDFIAGMIPVGDHVWRLAKEYIDGIPDAHRKFRDAKRTRAYVHAWLAARDAPRPMGSAITVGDLRHDAPIAQSLVAWLRNLYAL